jgi:Lrp/AsnC family transcriptional regulator for asnA, asnC and gidA
MEKLDVKDKKILYQLDIDSRQSFTAIGKKVGLSKDIVAYRVKRLQEKGIIKKFYTKINEAKLGYIHFRLYLTYQYTNPEIEEEIIKHFCENKYIEFIHSAEGDHDLVLVLGTKNIVDFYNSWTKTLNKYRNYFSNQIFSVFVKSYNYKHMFLIKDKQTKQTDKIKLKVYTIPQQLEIDNLDYKILKIIISDARIPTIEIAKKLDTTAMTINNRIKKLFEMGVIEDFRVSLDLSKIGYSFYKAFVNLRDFDKGGKIIDYISENPSLDGIDIAMGYSDMEFVFILQNTDELIEIMRDLYQKFPDTIKNYSYMRLVKTFKWSYLPEG